MPNFMSGKDGRNWSQRIMGSLIGESEHQRMLDGSDPGGIAVPGWVIGLTMFFGLGLFVVILFRTGNLVLGIAAAAGLAVLVWLGFALAVRLRRRKK